MHRSTPVAVGLSTLALVGAAVLALTPSQADDAAGQTVTAQAASTECNGGAVLGLKAKTQPAPFSFAGTSNTMIAVPGAAVAVKGPVSGTDTLLVTFSAEAYYQGTGWMGLEVRLDGTPIQPFANNGSPFAFASKPQYEANSAQFCTRVGPGTHRVSVHVSTTGGATESGWVDDWTFSVLKLQ